MTTELPGCPGNGVSRRCPGPARRTDALVPSTTTRSWMSRRGTSRTASGSARRDLLPADRVRSAPRAPRGPARTRRRCAPASFHPLRTKPKASNQSARTLSDASVQAATSIGNEVRGGPFSTDASCGARPAAPGGRRGAEAGRLGVGDAGGCGASATATGPGIVLHRFPRSRPRPPRAHASRSRTGRPPTTPATRPR